MDLQEQIGLNRRFIRCSTGEIIGKKHGWALIRAWVLNRDNTVHVIEIGARKHQD